MAMRPYVLTGASALRRTGAALTALHAAWAAEWGLPLAAFSVAVRRAADERRAAQGWQMTGAGSWQAIAPGFAGALQDLLFPPPLRHAPRLPAPLAAACAGRALAALRERLNGLAQGGAAALPQDQAPPASIWADHSGALLCEVRCGGPALSLLIGHEALAPVRLAAPLPPLAPVPYERLLAQVPVRLPVRLGEAQADLAAVLGLQVGDVVRLDSHADRALPLALADGSPLCSGYLGRRKQLLALDLVRESS